MSLPKQVWNQFSLRYFSPNSFILLPKFTQKALTGALTAKKQSIPTDKPTVKFCPLKKKMGGSKHTISYSICSLEKDSHMPCQNPVI